MLDTGEFCRLMLQRIPCNRMFTLDHAIPVLQVMKPEAFEHCGSIRAKRITARHVANHPSSLGLRRYQAEGTSTRLRRESAASRQCTLMFDR